VHVGGAAGLPNFISDRLAGFGTQLNDVDFGALAGKKQGNGAAYATAAPRDDGLFSG
jgi:hypothetical protein